jgi:hypothetical protein
MIQVICNINITWQNELSSIAGRVLAVYTLKTIMVKQKNLPFENKKFSAVQSATIVLKIFPTVSEPLELRNDLHKIHWFSPRS